MAYEWLRVLHIISFVAWMAGLFYLPRLYVYHTQQEIGSAASDTFKVMERKLLRLIMNPAMIATWIFGLWLAAEIDAWRQGWFHGKMALVVLMTGFHHGCGVWRGRFAEDRNHHSERFYRVMNEVPTVLLIGIVILVVVKPF
jgi:putative membrane protein